jgi:hypothetical protein
MTVNATIPATRELRALELYRERGHLIERTGPWTYLVPSMSGGEPYSVNYKTERCDCPDFEYRGVLCAHVYAVGIHRAKKRGASSGICPREDVVQTSSGPCCCGSRTSNRGIGHPGRDPEGPRPLCEKCAVRGMRRSWGRR